MLRYKLITRLIPSNLIKKKEKKNKEHMEERERERKRMMNWVCHFQMK